MEFVEFIQTKTLLRSKNMLSKFRFISVALLTLALSAFAFGQGTTGEIEGTVTDQTGAVVPGATVRVQSTGTTAGFSRTVTVDSNGYFIVPNLQPGAYTVTVESSGFDAFTRTVTVVVDKATAVNASLAAAGSIEEVDVDTSGAVTIDMADTKIDTNITKEIIDALPKGTNFSSLLKVAPNVRPEALGGGFQIDGASGSENVFVIDGQEVTNFRTGSLTPNSNLPFELLQEVQIKSTGFEAEYGGATGGVINVVTLGGNNDWHGNFGASFEVAKFQGDPNVVLSRFGAGPDAFEFFQPNKDGGTNFFPVAGISGPVIRDRLWFSAIYAPQIAENSRTIDFYVNPATGSPSSNPNIRTVSESRTYDTKVTTEQAFFRLDAQPLSRLRMFGTFLWNPIIQQSLQPVNTAGLTNPPTTFNPNVLRLQGGRQNSNTFNGQATWNPTNNLVINFRGGRTFLNEKLGSYNVLAVTRFFCRNVGSGPQSVPDSGCLPGFNSVPNNNVLKLDVSTRTTYDIDAAFVGLNAGGRHNIKFGYQWNRLFNSVDNGHVTLGVIVLDYSIPISSQAAAMPATGSTAANPSGFCFSPTHVPGDPCNLGSGWMQRFGAFGEASSVNQAFFVQDSWHIARRLTLNFGVRVEDENVPSFAEGTNEIKFGWGDKIAPRFGAAFDLTGDGKTKLFGSWGWFYDRFKYELPRGLFGGNFWRNDYFEILPSRGAHFSNYTFAAILGGRADVPGGTCPIDGGPGFSVCQLDFRIPANSPGSDIFTTGGVDPNLKAARQSEWTVGLERQLAPNMLLSARYTHKQLDRTVEDVGVVNTQGSEAYIISNPGFGLTCEVTGASNLPCPKAQRDYDAVEVRVDNRSTNYFYNASYTWSRLFGNYSGLASSDERGRTSPNVNRFFDLPPLGFTPDGVPDNGLLATDRPHVFKAYGGYIFDWLGNPTNLTTVSAFTTIQSGTPLTTIYNLYSLGTTILNGRGDLGRTEMFTETDLGISHRYRFGRDNRFSFEPFIDIRNLFDERNEIARQTSISTRNFNAISLRNIGGCTTCGTPAQTTGQQESEVFQTIFNRGGISTFVNNIIAADGGPLNTFDQPNLFQGGRNVRFGFRFVF
ncbi:MAG TPA: TonB-dependent receptor [Aridibacter sp.]|nr:TonB-dependent receptor [Aridibacter sp.]